MTQRTAIAFVHPLLTWVCEKACIQQSSAATSNINHYFNNDFFCSYHSLLNYANWSENGMFHAYVNHMNVACQSMANKNAMLIRNLTEEKNRFSFFSAELPACGLSIVSGATCICICGVYCSKRIDSATQQWQLKCVRWGAGTQNIAFSKFVQILRILVAYNWQTKTPPRNRFLFNDNIWCFCYDKNIEMRNVRSMFSIVTNGE